MNHYYYSFSSYLFNGYRTKLRRISLDAGFTCPNRDGTAGTGGCIYCNELGFSPFAGKRLKLEDQIEISIKRAGEASGIKNFIAYFQNATNTYAAPAELKKAYDVIRDYPAIKMLSVSTRPDCVDDEKLDLIESYTGDYEVWIEYGVQTAHNETLKAINRGHTFERSVNAIRRTAERGIKVGVHVILGLPGENADDMTATARALAELPVSGVKLHVLHVLKDTELERMYGRGEVTLLEEPEYVELACGFLENTRPEAVILRLVSDARGDVLVAPDWINNKLAVINRIEQEFARRGTRQGSAL